MRRHPKLHHPRGWSVVLGTGVSCIVLVLVAGQLRADPTGAPAAAGATARENTLPLVPGIEDQYGPDGCAPLPSHPNIIDCGAPEPADGNYYADPAANARLKRRDKVKILYAYKGAAWLTSVTDTVHVLAETVRVEDSAAWAAQGLVINQLYQRNATQVRVVAELFGAGGVKVGQAAVAVDSFELRPGEPAPFRSVSDVPRAAVSNVSWSVTYAEAHGGIRLLLNLAAHAKSHGQRAPLELTGYREAPGDHARPMVMWGEVQNVDSVAYRNPGLIIAYDDGTDAILAQVSTRLMDDDGKPLTLLQPGKFGVYVIVVDEPTARAQEATQGMEMFWVTGTAV